METKKHPSSIYLIKCASFYKIGFSKNPSNRRKTIQTHCPLKVELLATFKTINYVELEKELHNLFISKKTQGEWFELSPEDLIKLKLEYGFTFNKKINKITQDESFSYNSSEIKKIRFNNQRLSELKSSFEEYFDCTINDVSPIKYCLKKYGYEACEMAILDLYNQDYDINEAFDKIKKFASFNHKKINTPSEYLTDITCAIYRNHYNYPVDSDIRDLILDNMSRVEDVDGHVKKMNSQKFYMKEPEFWDKIVCGE